MWEKEKMLVTSIFFLSSLLWFLSFPEQIAPFWVYFLSKNGFILEARNILLSGKEWKEIFDLTNLKTFAADN